MTELKKGCVAEISPQSESKREEVPTRLWKLLAIIPKSFPEEMIEDAELEFTGMGGVGDSVPS